MEATRRGKPRVLIVEDDPDARALAAGVLSEFCEVWEADDALSAIGKLHWKVPDLVIMDYSLPGADGLQLTQRIRSDPRIREVPVLFMTGHTVRLDSGRLRELGASGLLSKPVSGEALLSKVRLLLGPLWPDRTAKTG